MRALFHQVRFASNSLVAISALFLTLATATSIPSVVLLRRLRIRPVNSLVEIATRSRRLWPIRSDHGSAPFDPTYSMISSALASNDCGMLRPSAFAVLRLITS